MGKTLVITGASRGIGLATAQLFESNGFKIINISRSPCPIQGATNIVADLMDIDNLKKLKKPLTLEISDSQKIVLVHNAALLKKGGIHQINAGDLSQAMAVNVVAAASINRLVIPHMRPGSSIIYIGSTLSEKGVANSASYVISKHAIAGMMRATCQDLAHTGIHTACVCPGFTETEMLREHIGTAPELLASIASTTTYNRLIDPLEIAETIVFCSNSPVVNGALIHANLGQIER